MNWFLVKADATHEQIEYSLAEDGLFPDDYELIQIDSDELIGDTLPPVVSQNLVVEIDGEYFRIDFEDVMNLINYLPEKPIVVCQLLLKLSMALTNLYLKYREKHEYAEEELKVWEAQQVKMYSSKGEENPYADRVKITAASVDALVKASPNWRMLKDKERQAGLNKGMIWEAREYVLKTYGLCLEYLKKLDNIEVYRTVSDRSFKQTVVNVAASTIGVEDTE